MNDFDRELARCIGGTLAGAGSPTREVVASCYQETLRKLDSRESEQVSEKWIDYVWMRIEGLKVAGKNNEQIARGIFELIAKA